MTKRRTAPSKAKPPTEERLQQLVRREVSQISIRHSSVTVSPLPPAEEAEHYESFLPGFTDRFVAIAEKAQADDIASRKREDILGFTYSLISLLLAFTLAAGAIGGGIYLLATNKPLGGYALLVSAGGTILTSMWLRSRANAKKS